MEGPPSELPGKPRVPQVGAWLGASVMDAPTGNGVVIAAMAERGPAAHSPLQEGDIVQAVDGQAVGTAEALKAIMAQKTGGQPLVLDVLRKDTPLQVELTPSDWPQ